MAFFPYTVCQLSRIFNKVLEVIIELHGFRLKTVNAPWIDVKMYSDKITEKGSPFRKCFGFVDGTVRPICRPSRNQKDFYNGHKRVHALKFQSVSHPDGMISQMFGPVQGRRHDAHLLNQSNLISQLEGIELQLGSTYYLYGDPAYPLRKNLIVPFKGNRLTRVQTICNMKMSKVREAVEWGFGKILMEFAFVDFKTNLMIYKQQVANYYLVATLMSNCHSCMYGNQTSVYFSCPPPSIEVYLS